MKEVQIRLDSEPNKRRDRGGCSKSSLIYIQEAESVIQEFVDYWPLTLRQVYYQLVSAGLIDNNLKAYNKLSRMLVKARLGRMISWDALEDRARSTLYSWGWTDSKLFVEDQLSELFDGYRRDLLQTQDVALEIWVEKDALSRICHKVAFPYCVPVIVARGFASVSYAHECRKRVEYKHTQGQRTEILYFGDLDPSGWEMLPSMMETLQVEMKLGDLVTGIRCALTPDQVEAFNLPRNPDALKLTDTRAKKYIDRFGDLAVELDALKPPDLESIVRQAIEDRLDLSQFEHERRREAHECTRIERLRNDVFQFTTVRIEEESHREGE